MKSLLRTLMVLFLLAALLPARGAQAQEISAGDPTCLVIGQQLGVLAFTGETGGSKVCVLVPAQGWNGELVVFAHGYVKTGPVAIPWEQLIDNQAGTNLPGIVTGLGYALGITSYEKNGLAIKPAVQDVLELVEYAKGIAAGQGAVIRRVYLTGASEGGLVTTLAVEQHPEVFAGGLATCGPIGNMLSQVQYWTDFRAAFDRVYPANPLAQESTPIYIPQDILDAWDAGLGAQVVGATTTDWYKARDLLWWKGVPYDLLSPKTVYASIDQLLWYNVYATNDGRVTLRPDLPLTTDSLKPPALVGNPYTNVYYRGGYPGGIQADPLAVKEIQKYYTTSAGLKVPLVAMHTTGDPVVPANQALMYMVKALRAGTLGKVTYLPVPRYGHCAFQPAELVIGFYTMVLRATLSPFTPAQVQAALPSETERARFETLKLDVEQNQVNIHQFYLPVVGK